MQLIFTETIDNKPSYFVEKISNSLLLGMGEYLKYLDLYQRKFGKRWDGALGTMKPKKHSIREDKSNRWKVGNKIHFIINPYNKNRFQFAPVLSVVAIQKIRIVPNETEYEVLFFVEIDDRRLNRKETEQLALNDGFDCLDDFLNYFKDGFEGKIIHWTHDFKY